MSAVRRFRLDADAEVGAFVAGLGRRVALEPESVELVERTVHDTFDWRLHGQGTVIELERDPATGDAEVVWRSVADGTVLARLDRERAPRFAWDLDPGPVADRLGAVIEMRALLPLTTFTARRTTLRLLDDEHKTVARLVADEVVDPDGRAPEPVLSVMPLRGYGREARVLTEVLDAQVLLAPDADDLATAVLRRDGYAPGSYSSKLRVRLDPDGPAAAAWLEVLRRLFAAMRTNEAGLRDDVDSEFLHDFRVAVRRTRSVLGEAEGVLDPEVLARAKVDFKWLGGATSPTRDLDVFLLDTATFADTLAPERRPDLEPFTAYLEARQREAHRALVADLDRERYAALVEWWSAVLDAPATAAAGPDAGRPAPEVAAERITRAHGKLVRRGRRIHRTSDAEHLHDLRKDAKRLRYLLECFGSLFPAGELAPIVKQLKGVQDVLGTFQDGQVQSAQLERFAQDLLERGDVPAATLMAIGLLVEQLHERSEHARAEFADRFAAFDTKAVRRAVHRLLDEHHPHGADPACSPTAHPTTDPLTERTPEAATP